MKGLLKSPLAWLPIIMSIAAFVLVISYLAIFGVVYHEDEGTAAHLWQLLMAGQIPMIFIIVVKYIPNKSRQVLGVLLIQFIAGIIAASPVFFLGL